MISINDISRFAVIGSGTMGARIGLQAALSGFEVTLYDIDKNAFVRAEKEYERITSMLTKSGRYNRKDVESARESIHCTTQLQEACKGADFVSENVYEDLQLKKKVWNEISSLVGQHTILTTNTSYLLPSDFAIESGASARFCAFHFHDVFTARVVDIMPHPGTDSGLVDLLHAMGLRLHQIPVIIRQETHGYIFNKLFGGILLQSGIMYAEGIASVEDIDRSWMGNFGMKIGPFGMMDEVGLDTLYKVMRMMQSQGSDKFIDLIKQYISEGRLGVKTSKGFYNYPNPSFKNKDFL